MWDVGERKGMDGGKGGKRRERVGIEQRIEGGRKMRKWVREGE